MHVDKTKQDKYLEIQKKLCGDSFKVRSLSTSTIKTYINASFTPLDAIVL